MKQNPDTSTPLPDTRSNDSKSQGEINPELSELISLAQAGDEEAMHRLVLHIMPRVRNGVRYLVRGDNINDLVQDVLVTILQRLDSYRREGRFESWVDGVTMRTVIGRMRQQRSYQRRLSLIDAQQEVIPLRHEERYATSRQLVRALDQISDVQRQALVMHYVFGLTASEIATELQIPWETARSRIRDGMSQLRALMRVYTEEQ